MVAGLLEVMLLLVVGGRQIVEARVAATREGAAFFVPRELQVMMVVMLLLLLPLEQSVAASAISVGGAENSLRCCNAVETFHGDCLAPLDLMTTDGVDCWVRDGGAFGGGGGGLAVERRRRRQEAHCLALDLADV